MNNVVANKLLDILKASSYSMKTRQVLSRYLAADGNEKEDFGNEDPHMGIRHYLNKLYAAGVISRNGVGSFSWHWKKVEWDRAKPFATLPGAPSPAELKPKKNYTYGKKSPSLNELYQQAYGKAPEIPETDGETDEGDRMEELKEGHDPRVPPLMEKVTEQDGEIMRLKEQVSDLERKAEKLEMQVKVLDEQGKSQVKVIKVEKYDGKVKKIKDVTLPKTFDRILSLAKCRRNILLVGPAGCGKTHVSKLVADTLDLDFAALSCTAGMSESHLLGRAVPDLTHGKNKFQGTDFLRVYEGGGIGLLDEFDAADSNMLLSVNSGLANGYMNVPNRPDNPIAKRSPDFVCIATANTFGRGATRMYAGRNQLDEATLDRFRIGIVECDYDPNVERRLCPDLEGEEYEPFMDLDEDAADAQRNEYIDRIVGLKYNLRGTCQYVRKKIREAGLRRIMSSRFLEDASVMVSKGGWTLRDVVATFLEGWAAEEVAKLVS